MNEKIFYFLYGLGHVSAFLDWLIIFIAQIFPYLVIILAGLFLLIHHDVLPSANPFKEFAKKWKEITLVFFTGIYAWIIATALKYLIHAPRPFDALPGISPLLEKTDYAFPSGHATAFMAIGMAIFFHHRRAGYVFIFFAVLIGLARVMAGVHFPLDILGGFAIGALTAYLVKNFNLSRS